MTYKNWPKKKPLATLNVNSRLPRLPVPSKMPVPMKRTRSPEEIIQVEKRSRIESSNGLTRSQTVSNLQTQTTRPSLRSQTSGSGLRPPTSGPSLRPQTSGSSLRPKTSGSSLRSQTSGSSLQPQTSGSSLRANNNVTKPKANLTTKPSTAKLHLSAPKRQAQFAVGPSTKQVSGATRGRNNSASVTSNSAPAPRPPTGAKAKRPGWDLKGRLQDMEELLYDQTSQSNTLVVKLENYNSRIAMLEQQNTHLSGTVAQKEQLVSMTSEEVGSLQRQLREAEDRNNDMKRELQQEIRDLTFLKDSLSRQKDRLDGEIATAITEINGLKATIAQLTSAQAGLNAELDSTKLQLEKELAAGREKDEEIRKLKGIIQNHENTIEDYQGKFREQESIRRKLHNSIQELKGNIRVFCRVRPLLEEECLGNDGMINHMHFPGVDQKTLEIEKVCENAMNESTLTASRRGNKYIFNFDKVFQPTSTQSDVFEEISQLVQSALDGYNVCIFAYGQTGSGKTYTMEGTLEEQNQGMIPRAVFQIFNSVKELENKGWHYKLEASFLEIYNETIRDLLGNGKEDLKHDIRLTGTENNDVTVTNLTIVSVETEQQINSLLKKASHNRAVAETKCNEHSSRSHSVFRLKLTGNNSHTGESSLGTLNLVDLAGSERLKESGAEGQRLKETLSINKSLSCLGNTIMALANKDSYVPYRNSKLTHLLQNSLGGNSKTLMFVNVSPKEECFPETLNSLRFATKVNQCNIGTAQKKTK